MKEEVGDLFEARVLSQVVDGVAPVEKDALFPVDEARLRCVEDDVAQTFIQCFGHCPTPLA